MGADNLSQGSPVVEALASLIRDLNEFVADDSIDDINELKRQLASSCARALTTAI